MRPLRGLEANVGYSPGSNYGKRPIADIRRCCETRLMVTIYMPLLNEGTDVWRPVQGTPLGSDRYRVEGHAENEEEWAFPPGAVVRCTWKTFRGGEEAWAAVALSE
jgi:hypothetical protein